MTEHAPFFGGGGCYRKPGFYAVYLRAKFDDSSFSRSRYIIGALNFKVGHVTLTTPLSEIACHPWASTYYGQPIYQI